MNQNILNLLQDKPLIVPKIVFQNYRKLNLTEKELVLLIYLMNIGPKILYNPEKFVQDLNIDKFKVMETLNELEEKKFISIIVEKNNTRKSEEYISLELFYSKLMNLLLEPEQAKPTTESDIFSTFENEFGRPLSPMEYEIIKGWTNEKIKSELIIEALKEATYNGVTNLRYIDKILYEWNKKGLKTKADVAKDKEKYRVSKKEKVDIYDYNWLEDE